MTTGFTIIAPKPVGALLIHICLELQKGAWKRHSFFVLEDKNNARFTDPENSLTAGVEFSVFLDIYLGSVRRMSKAIN